MKDLVILGEELRIESNINKWRSMGTWKGREAFFKSKIVWVRGRECYVEKSDFVPNYEFSLTGLDT